MPGTMFAEDDPSLELVEQTPELGRPTSSAYHSRRWRFWVKSTLPTHPIGHYFAVLALGRPNPCASP